LPKVDLGSLSMNTAVPIHQLTDYRSFLIAHAEDKKNLNPHWTYGSWAQQLGLKTTSSITKIIKGEREPGSEVTQKLISYFKFNSGQAQYFEDLVRLHKIKKDPRLSVLLMEKMAKDHPNGSIRILDNKTFSIISHWYYLTIREMVRLDQFFEDPKWISKKLHFKVAPKDIKYATKVLLEVGLLKRDKNGALNISQEGRIKTSDDIASEAIKRYHEQMLENAKHVLRNTDVNKREYSSATLALKTSNLSQAKEFVREFKNKFSKTFEEEKGDSVYQIQIQLFPLTKNEGKK